MPRIDENFEKSLHNSSQLCLNSYHMSWIFGKRNLMVFHITNVPLCHFLPRKLGNHGNRPQIFSIFERSGSQFTIYYHVFSEKLFFLENLTNWSDGFSKHEQPIWYSSDRSQKTRRTSKSYTNSSRGRRTNAETVKRKTITSFQWHRNPLTRKRCGSSGAPRLRGSVWLRC